MKSLFVLVSVVAAMLFSPALAQHHGHAGHGHGHGAQANGKPYAGLKGRAIKALSDEQVAGLKAGKGLGYAMAAELNGYPGPMHVLELASRLKLSPDQLARTKELFARMKTQAEIAGEQLIEAERELDSLFRDKKAAESFVSSAVTKAALAQGKVRETHLQYHLLMMDVLTPDQVATYNKLRGY